MDDADRYLGSNVRLREWMPELPGLHKLSKSEIQSDADTITSATAHAAIHNGSDGYDTTSRLSQRKGNRKNAAALNAYHNEHNATHNESNTQLTSTSGSTNGHGGSRRERLAGKISRERVLLSSAQSTAAQLRAELDHVRNEIISYTDHIGAARREIELAKIERIRLETSYTGIREQCQIRLTALYKERDESEATENELRQRLTKSRQDNADLSERISQLRQLEDEFKGKEQKIEQLEIELKAKRKRIKMLETLTKNISAASAGTPPASAAVPSTQPPLITSPTVTATASAPATDKDQQMAVSPTASAAASSSEQSTVNALSSPQPASLSSVLPSGATSLPADVYSELVDSIRTCTKQVAQLEKANSALESELLDKNSKLSELSRQVASLQTQLDRTQTMVIEALKTRITQLEMSLSEERNRVEAAASAASIWSKQREDQSLMINAYEERMKHFQQLLTAADVRADSANCFLSDVVRQVTVYRNGNRVLQQCVDNLRLELNGAIKERNELYDEMHEKINRWMEAKKDKTTANTPTASTTPSTLSFFETEARSMESKTARVQTHYAEVSVENERLRTENTQLQARIRVLEDAAQTSMSAADHEEKLNAVYVILDAANQRVSELEAKLSAAETDNLQIRANSRASALMYQSQIDHLQELQENERRANVRIDSAAPPDGLVKTERSAADVPVDDDDDANGVAEQGDAKRMRVSNSEMDESAESAPGAGAHAANGVVDVAVGNGLVTVTHDANGADTHDAPSADDEVMNDETNSAQQTTDTTTLSLGV